MKKILEVDMYQSYISHVSKLGISYQLLSNDVKESFWSSKTVFICDPYISVLRGFLLRRYLQSICKTNSDNNGNLALKNLQNASTIRFLRQNIVLKKYPVTLSASCLQTCINFTTSNNYLPIENGSWLRIELNERKCSKCDLNETGDQFHCMFRCKFFNADKRIKDFFDVFFAHPIAPVASNPRDCGFESHWRPNFLCFSVM